MPSPARGEVDMGDVQVQGRAAVLREVGRPMAIERIAIGPLAPGDVLVKVEAASPCHTDPEAIEGQLALVQERRIIRSSHGGARPAEDFPAMARAWLDGRLDLDPLITARIPLEQINERFAALKRGETIRSAVTFG